MDKQQLFGKRWSSGYFQSRSISLLELHRLRSLLAEIFRLFALPGGTLDGQEIARWATRDTGGDDLTSARRAKQLAASLVGGPFGHEKELHLEWAKRGQCEVLSLNLEFESERSSETRREETGTSRWGRRLLLLIFPDPIALAFVCLFNSPAARIVPNLSRLRDYGNDCGKEHEEEERRGSHT